MLRTKVKINKVGNLTDARYFAAMGVDYLGFCCNVNTEMYCSTAKIKQIIEWVEGPQFVLEFDGWQTEEDILSLASMNMANALHFGAFSSYTSSFPLPVFKDFILENVNEVTLSNVDIPVLRTERQFKYLTSTEKSAITSLVNQREVFLDIDFDSDDLEEMFSNWDVYGLILRGGAEEKVGLKSFDKLDDIFEILSN